jgi:N-acyl-D-aspartate/D-glutamate deacylase
MAEFDLVVRGGVIADGTGGDLREADIAITGGKITAIGVGLGAGVEEVDARGKIAMPGFVDIHTHFDGQASWDSHLEPSSAHGVTTAIMGNCGVGFAPCRPQDRDALIRLMEGVEDIPGAALAEGLTWNWESFPDYLDALALKPRDIDIAAQIPHGALRVYVMGARGIARDRATPTDIEQMAVLVDAAMAAGAVGLATSRTIAHRASDGSLTPMYGALRDELGALTAALKGRGVFQMVSDFADEEAEFALLEDAAASGAAATSFSLLQADIAPNKWRSLLARAEGAHGRGLSIRPQVLSRPIGVLMGLEASVHTFLYRPSFQPLRDLPLGERVARMRDPAVRAAILRENDEGAHPILVYFGGAYSKLFPMGAAPDYAPPAEDSFAARAAAAGSDPQELIYDWLISDDGKALIYLPLYNYTANDLSVCGEMLAHPLSLHGLADGGAHVGTICDGSASTYLLTQWVRDRGEMGLSRAAKMLAADPAAHIGLHDRGVLAPGKKADVAVIDLDALSIDRPRIVHDLPAGGKRFLQAGRGYEAMIVSGVVTRRRDVVTGALPGRVVRGRQG